MVEPFALVTFGISFTYLSMPAAIRIANRMGAVDLPDPTKLHFRSVACAGGLAIFATILAAMALLAASGCVQSHLRLSAIALGAIAVFICGVVDDVRGVGPRSKLAVQTVASAVLFAAGLRAGSLSGVDIPVVLDFALSTVWIIVITNGMNFIDGLDGLAAGTTATSSLALAALFLSGGRVSEAGVALVLAGAAIGFAPYNISPAKAFMGDSGSMLAGFVLGALVLSAADGAGVFEAVLLPALVLSLPIVDTVLCVWRRCGRNLLARVSGCARVPAIMSRDLLHVHHRILARDRSHRSAAATILLASASAALAALLCAHSGTASRFLFSGFLAFLVVCVYRHVAHIERDVTRDLLRKLGGAAARATAGASGSWHSPGTPEAPAWWLSDGFGVLLCGSDSDRHVIICSNAGKPASFTRLSSEIPQECNGYDPDPLDSILSDHRVATIVVTSALSFEATETIRRIADSHRIPVVRWISAHRTPPRPNVAGPVTPVSTGQA